MRLFVGILMCLALMCLPVQVSAGPSWELLGGDAVAGGGGGASAFTDLTDTPGTITADSPVVGNGAGNALVFGTDDDVPESGDFGAAGDLEADGTLSTGSVADNEIDYSAVTLDDFDYQTAWRIFYSNTDGDVTELVLGAVDTVLTSQGAAAAPIFSATGAGDVTDVWGCSSGDCSVLTAAAGDAIDATSADYSIPCVIAADCSGVTAEGRCCWDSDDDVYYVGDGAAAKSWAGGGDVTGAGDCASGACYDGSSDGGTYVRLYDGDSHYGALVTDDLTADRTFTFPDESGTIVTDQSDDDVPESGDFGAAYALDSDGDISTGIIEDYHIDFTTVTLMDFDYENTWRMYYSNAAGQLTELPFGAVDEILTSTGATGAPVWTGVGGGDVVSVGDCATGACLDGTVDGGTQILFTDGGAFKTTLQAPAGLGGDITINLPSASSTLAMVPGADGNVVYNNGGALLGGESGFFYNDTDNRLGLGTDSPSFRLHVYGTDEDGSSILAHRVEDNVAGPNIFLYSADAALGARDENDNLGYINFLGYDGDQYIKGAYIAAKLTAATGDDDLPTSIEFYTTPDGSDTAVLNMVLDEAGELNLKSGAGVSEFSVDDTFAGDSDDAVPTEQAVKAYVDTGLATKEGDLSNEAGLYAALSDVELFLEDLVDDATPTLGGALDGGDFAFTNVGTVGLDDIHADTDNGPFYIGDGADQPIIQVDGTPSADDTDTGIVVTSVNCGEVIAQWDLVYMDDTENEWMLADANAAGKFPATGMAVEACADGNPGTILIQGVVRNAGWAGDLTGEGKAIYLSETAGGITETAPSDATDCVQHVGRVLSDANDTVLINPNTLWVEIAA